ncbi:MAG: hypothetical protein M3Q30_08330 [Actinomycetota bacterium]|nr:hypothetical protein [Actinomycetota bacterium]
MTLTWGVGQYVDRTGRRVAWDVTHAEIRRDTDGATTRLEAIGVEPGRRVLWCSMLSEAAQFWPFIIATMLRGAQLSCADATRGEAARVAMFTRQMTYHAVLGVNGALLDGLDDLGRPYADVFGEVSVLGARPDAHGRLVAAGLRPTHFVLVGPAVAIGDAPGAPARVDSTEWALHDIDRLVAVTNLAERATHFDRTTTAIRARQITTDTFAPVSP